MKKGINLQLFGMAAGFIDLLVKSGQYKPLTDAQINYLVTKGGWMINVELRQAPLGPVLSEGVGDSNAMAGEGVSDLLRVQEYMNMYPWGRFAVDVGDFNSYGSYVFIGTNDIIRWLNVFIATWGTVDRPAYWANQPTVLPPQYVNPGIVWP